MERYSIINEKNKREIILLRGSGCIYKKCTFCDYYSDACQNEEENFKLNSEVISKISGKFKNLEVINSGSVFELDEKTLALIKSSAKEKGIKTIHFESHWLYKDKIDSLRKYFSDFEIKMKLGLETFDFDFREKVLKKGITEKNADEFSKYFDEANFLFGIDGQTAKSMVADIELGLKTFERICVNIMCNNSTSIKPSEKVIKEFIKNVYPLYKDNEKVDILLNNTDFGVGD